MSQAMCFIRYNVKTILMILKKEMKRRIECHFLNTKLHKLRIIQIVQLYGDVVCVFVQRMIIEKSVLC